MRLCRAARAAAAGWLTGTLVEHAVAVKAAQAGAPVELLDPAIKRPAELTGYSQAFLTYAAVYVATAALWLFIRPDRPVEVGRDAAARA